MSTFPPTILQTTFSLARASRACKEDFDRAARTFGIALIGEETPIGLDEIAEKVGIEAALWCLRCVLPGQEAARNRFARLFACRCAFSVLPLAEKGLPGDDRPRNAIRVARRYALGEATAAELAAASAEAWEASWAASSVAAEVASRSASWAAAKFASTAASRAAAEGEPSPAFRADVRFTRLALFIGSLRGTVRLDDFPGLDDPTRLMNAATA